MNILDGWFIVDVTYSVLKGFTNKLKLNLIMYLSNMLTCFLNFFGVVSFVLFLNEQKLTKNTSKTSLSHNIVVKCNVYSQQLC